MVPQASHTERGSASPGGTRSASLAPQFEQKFIGGNDMPAYDTGTRTSAGSSSRLRITWSGGAPRESTGAPARLIQNVRKPKDFAPHASQPLLETKPIERAGARSFSTARR